MSAAGRGILLFHGLGRAPEDWDGVRPGLGAGGEVRAPRLPRDPEAALAVARDAVRDGDLLVGHSLGGVLALRLAAERGDGLRGLVLTGCFFPPARNGRGLVRSLADYGAHRVAFVRLLGRRRDGAREGGSAGALVSLVRLAATPGGFGALLDRVRVPVLALHARDDHHVPVDFALAAAAGRPGWTVEVLEGGGHHPHVDVPERWLAAVLPWLALRD